MDRNCQRGERSVLFFNLLFVPPFPDLFVLINWVNFFMDDPFLLGNGTTLFSLPPRNSVLNLRLPNFDLLSKNTNYFAIAPDGNRNSISAMFGDRFGHSLPKRFFGFVCQKEGHSFTLFHWFPLYFNKILKRSGSSISVFPDSSTAIIFGTSPELSKIVQESAKGL